MKAATKTDLETLRENQGMGYSHIITTPSGYDWHLVATSEKEANLMMEEAIYANGRAASRERIESFGVAKIADEIALLELERGD